MRWWHVTIVGKIGTVEQVAHTFNFRTKPTHDADQSPANGITFAGQVGAAWQQFLNHGIQNQQVKNQLSPSLTYTEVRAAYLEQTTPATITSVAGRKGPKKAFHYPRPTYLVPTQYFQFPAGVTGGGNAGDLPWEVACAVSLTTGLRGGANRGRVYLGPLDKGSVDNAGLFQPVAAESLSASLGQYFLGALNAASGNEAVVVSRAYNGNAPITGTKVGLVPDSQRRRRRSLKETPVVTWGPGATVVTT